MLMFVFSLRFVRPLYKALFKSAVGSSIARETFITNSGLYHPICRKMLATDLGVELADHGSPTPAPAPAPASSSTGSGSSCNSTSMAASKEESANYFPILAAAFAGAAIVAFHAMKKQ